MWIMEKMGGQWPSLAPTNSILQHRAPPRQQATPRKTAPTTLVTSGYLGDPKKPPFSAPRQDNATRMGIVDARPWRARLANVCRQKEIKFHHPFMILVTFSVNTDHSHSVRQQQLAGGHHGVVGHVNQHVKDRHGNHGADYCQWDVSDASGENRQYIRTGGEELGLFREWWGLPVWIYNFFSDEIQIKPEEKTVKAVRAQQTFKSLSCSVNSYHPP